MSEMSEHVNALPCVKRGRKVKKELSDDQTVGRKSKKSTTIKNEPLDEYGDIMDSKQRKLTDMLPVKKKRDRFNGMTEDEVLCRTLPDHLVPGLDIAIIGINPGLTAAYVGHHYAGPGNHFWKCLFLSGLTPEQMNAYDDIKLKEFGIGFTNIVERTSRGSADLTRKEIKEGAEILAEKIRKFRPKIAVFNGKGIYEIFCGHKKFFIGKQPEPFPGTDTVIYVMPSSSARCSQLPRAVDKVPFYIALKKLRDYLCGTLQNLDDSEVTFPELELKVEPKKECLEDTVNVKTEIKVNTVTNGEIATKRRKKKSTKVVEADVLADELPMLPPPDCHPAIKLEPGVAETRTPFMLNRFPLDLPGNISPFIFPSYSAPVMIKEELPQDLSQYGKMPSSAGSSSLPGDILASQSYTSTTSFSPLAQSFITTGSLSWPVASLPSVYSHPLTNLAASFSYASHLSAFPKITPSVAQNKPSTVRGSARSSSNQ